MTSTTAGTSLSVWPMVGKPSGGQIDNSHFYCQSLKSMRARARGVDAEPQLVSFRRLAKCMLKNELDENCKPIITGTIATNRKRRHATLDGDHRWLTRPNFTSVWLGHQWKQVSTKHCKTKCTGCGFKCRNYCACNKASTLCRDCYDKHLLNF